MNGSKSSITIGLTFALGLTLSSCSGVPNQTQNASQSADTESNVSSEIEETLEIPDTFPTNIPLHNGPLVVSSSSGESPNMTWAIEVIVENLDLARQETITQLEGAGFTLQTETGIGTETYEATLIRADFTIRLKIYLEPETGEREIRYVVFPTN